MKDRCKATTVAGTPCRNGLGCHLHRAHCAEKIRTRALRASQVEPEQCELPLLTWREAQSRINAGYWAQKSISSGDCGCQG